MVKEKDDTVLISKNKEIRDVFEGKMLLKYIVFPHLIYWGLGLGLGFIFLYFKDLSLCGLDNNCGPEPDNYIIILEGIVSWVILTLPIFFFVIFLISEYKKAINVNLLKKDKSNIKFKCNNCGNDFHINRGIEYCPKCEKPIRDICTLYCSKCETEIDPGEIVCSHCFDVPKEIIVETPDGKRVKTTFNDK